MLSSALITMVAASTTVGTPMAMTGIPMVSSVRPFRWFPTPEPGWIPVSVSWIVEFSLYVERAARASITIMTSGSVCFTTPRMISAVSIPFFAITPGASALISCIFSLL